MSSPKTIYDWPGLMKRATASRFCDMTPTKFERAVFSGDLPMPLKINGEERWYRHELESRPVEAPNAGSSGWRARSPLYADDPRLHEWEKS